MALNSEHVPRREHAHALPNAGSLSHSPPSPDFCSLVSTSSPADCTKGKLITAHTTTTQPPAEPQSLPLSACLLLLLGCPHPLLGSCHQHTSAHEGRHEPSPAAGRVPVGRRRQAGPPGRGEQGFGSAGAEGAGEEAPRPSRGVLPHVLWLCPSLCISPAKVRAWHPRTGVMPGKGCAAHPASSPLQQLAAQAQSPPVPVMSLTGPVAPCPWDKLQHCSFLNFSSVLGVLGCICTPEIRFPRGRPHSSQLPVTPRCQARAAPRWFHSKPPS